MLKEFKKSDLKSGMAVCIRKRGIGLIVNDLIIYSHGFGELKDYNDDLTSDVSKLLDIVSVYAQSHQWASGLSGGVIHGELIWKRKEIIEVTLDDIAKKFGTEKDCIRILA